MDTLYLFSEIMITLLMEFLWAKRDAFDYFCKIVLRYNTHYMHMELNYCEVFNTASLICFFFLSFSLPFPPFRECRSGTER